MKQPQGMQTHVYTGTALASVMIVVWCHWSEVHLSNHSIATMEKMRMASKKTLARKDKMIIASR